MKGIATLGQGVDAVALPWRAPSGVPATAAGVADIVELSRFAAAVPSLLPSAVLTPLAAACPAVIPLQIAADLETHGFRLLYKRRFWIPFLRPHRVELTAQAFTEQLQQGSTRLEVASKEFVPAPVRESQDLSALSAFYLGGCLGAVPNAPLMTAVGTLYQNGFSFSHRGKACGPYGAYRALADGGNAKVVARKYSAADVALQGPQDVYRTQFFRSGIVSPALEKPAEAATLKALEARNAVLWTGDSTEDRTTAERAYQRLFQGGRADGLWAGTRETPLVELRAGLADAAGSTLRFDQALAEHQQILHAGIPKESGRRAWDLVRPTVESETLAERVQWMRALIGAEWGEPEIALSTYEYLAKKRGAGRAMDSAVKEYVELRQALGQGGQEEARQCFVRLRDQMERALPGTEPADEKRALYVQLLKALGTGEAVEKTWRSLDGVGSRADRVAVFLDLLTQEHDNPESARADYRVVVKESRPGETVMQSAQDFKRIRAMLGRYGSADACAAFRFLRRDLDESLPGPWKTAEREAMFTSLLQATGNFDVARKAWRTLANDSFFSGPQPPADFEQRLQAWLDLYHAESGHFETTKATFDMVLGHLRAGETVDHAVAEYVGLRQRLGDDSAAIAREAFAFLRGDIGSALDGPLTVADKERIYLKVLTVVRDHDAAVKAWRRVRGSGAAPTDFAERIDVFLDLCGLERFEADQVWKSYDVVLDNRRAGESLADALKAFGAWRGRVGKYDSDGGRDAFVFVRRDLGQTLPGPWNDLQREAMYARVLGVERKQSAAVETWKELIGKAPSADFPDLVDAYAQLAEMEGGSSEAGKAALQAVRDLQSRHAGTKLPALVAEYRSVRGYVGEYATSDAIALLKFVVETLPASERSTYLQLQDAVRDWAAAQQAWTDLKKDPKDFADRVAVLVDCLRKEQRDMTAATEQLDAICTSRRPNETIPQAAQALDRIRTSVPTIAGEVVAAAFRYMRENAEASQETVFINMLKACESLTCTTQTWESLQNFGTKSTMGIRAQMVLSQPVEQWPAMLGTLERLSKAVPQGVDAERGSRALLRLATVSDSRALSIVLTRLDATPGLDRTTALEWLCAMMSLAGSIEAFEQGWRDVHRPGAPGAVAERQLLMANLVEANRDSSDGFAASVDMLRRLDRVPATDWMGTAEQGVALASALRGRAADASKALTYILDARDQGRFANETLDETLARFATLYAATNSVEMSLARLEQAAPAGGGTIQDDKDGDLIIGGIRVPRGNKPRPPESFVMRAWEELRRMYSHATF